jgi:hypothetical protein
MTVIFVMSSLPYCAKFHKLKESKTNMRLLAVDPGVTTGYVIIDITDLKNPIIEEQGNLRGIESCVEELLKKDFDFAVCEDFRLRVQAAKEVAVNDPELHSTQIKALLKWELKDKITIQNPSQRLSTHRMQKLFNVKRFSTKHIADAARHGGAYIVKRTKIPKNNGPSIKFKG